MSVELSRRLIHSGAATAKVEAALFAAVERRISLSQALAELHPELLFLLERVLERGEFPAIHTVRALPELVRRLPLGMCERLLALPVHIDARSDRVDVAAVDVLDGHVEREFSFHLQAPVRVLRAPFSELASALEGVHRALSLPPAAAAPSSSRVVALPAASEISSERPGLPSLRPSDQPIPLVRRSLPPSQGRTGDDARVSLAPQSRAGEESEPVLSLRRSKPFTVPVPEDIAAPWRLDFEVAVAAIQAATSPEQVVAHLSEGLQPVRSLVFAVRRASFDVRGGSAELGSLAELRAVSVPSGNGNLLDAAARLGYSFGPRAQLSALLPLAGRWGAVASGGDYYARTVNVSDRPSLILVMAGFLDSAEATRRADALARTASGSLESIVRSRKRS